MLRLLEFGGAAALLILSAGPARAEGKQTQPLRICADFVLFPNGQQFPAPFTLAGFRFGPLGGAGAPQLAVVSSGTGKGLQFPQAGLKVTLPAPVPKVDLKLGTFAGPVKVASLDDGGQVIHTVTVSGTNMFQAVTVSAPQGKRIAALHLTGGGNEGNLAEICITVTVAP
jgi:hypothetical protein